ncbi:MAG: hypothetical protein WCO60_04345 [Verrucomicrobiota bacterium]
MVSRWWILLIGLLSFSIRFHNLTQVLVDGHFYFVDGDCYSRMARAQMVSKAPGTVVHFQQFENWPEGVVSHATAPLDYLIVGLDRVVRMVWPKEGRLAVLGEHSLDIAGALVSPLLGVALCVCVGFWARGLRRSNGDRLLGWWCAPLLLAISPAMVHATVLGRPDHQSLIVFCVGLALIAEQRLLCAPTKIWSVLGGAMWGLSIWVSLFEPLILWGCVCIAGLVLARREWLNPTRLLWGVTLAVCLTIAYMIEGLPFALPNLAFQDTLMRWGASIGELHSLDQLEALGGWLSALCWVAPVALWFCVRSEKDASRRWLLLSAGLLFLTLLLTIWQIRWSPYLALCFVLLTPWILSSIPRQSLVMLVAGLSLWPIAREWDELWFPDAETSEARYLDRSERINARLAALRMRSDEVLPFVAPWWLSPSISYWSGQPAVAGTGHEGIAGILDTARFFLTEDPKEARAILERRKVKLVVAGDPSRAVKNSMDILGKALPRNPLAEQLWGSSVDPAWGLVGEKNITTFRVLDVVPTGVKTESQTPVENAGK